MLNIFLDLIVEGNSRIGRILDWVLRYGPEKFSLTIQAAQDPEKVIPALYCRLLWYVLKPQGHWRCSLFNTNLYTAKLSLMLVIDIE